LLQSRYALLPQSASQHHAIRRILHDENNTRANYVLALLLMGLGFAYALRVIDISEDTSAYKTVVWSGALYSVAPNMEWSDRIRRRMNGIKVTPGDRVAPDAYLFGGIQKLYGLAPEIVVLGDSHGLMWASLLDESARSLGKSIAFFTADATSPFLSVPPVKAKFDGVFFTADQKFAFDMARLKMLNEWRPKIVVISARWSGYELAETKALIDYLGTIGSHVLLIEQPPELYFGDKNAPQFLSYLGMTPLPGTKQYLGALGGSAFNRGRALLDQIVSSCNYCSRVTIADLFQDGSSALVIDSHDVLYIDDDHLSQAGALRAKDRILASLRTYGG
jgi:hypothetical protein